MFCERLASEDEQQTERQRDDEADTGGRRQRNCQPSENGDAESPCEAQHLASLKAPRNDSQATNRSRQPASTQRGGTVGGKSKNDQEDEACSPGDRECQRDALRSQPREEDRQPGDEEDPRRDFGDRPEARMSNPIDPVCKNAPAGHEEGREEEDFGDRGRFREILAEEERDELARHELEDADDQRRQPEPEEEEPPHGAACRGAIALGGHLWICNEADARGYDPGKIRECLSDDVEAEGHRGQEEADDSLVEANHIDRRQAPQESLEPEPQHLPPRRRRVILRVLGKPADREEESDEAPDEVDGRPQRHEQDKAGRVQHVDDDHAHDVGDARGNAEGVVRGKPPLALQDREAEAQCQDPWRQEERDRGRELDALRLGMRHAASAAAWTTKTAAS